LAQPKMCGAMAGVVQGGPALAREDVTGR
jgi:hypothetical protein